jgi:hypothetical protein
MVGKVRFEARIQELVENTLDLRPRPRLVVVTNDHIPKI